MTILVILFSVLATVLRFLGQAMLRPDQTTDYRPPGVLHALLGLGIDGDVSSGFRFKVQQHGAMDVIAPEIETYPYEARQKIMVHRPAFGEEREREVVVAQTGFLANGGVGPAMPKAIGLRPRRPARRFP